MALVKCKECGAEISDQTNKCPQCGKPRLSKTGKFAGIGCASVLGLIVLIIFLAVLAPSDKSEKSVHRPPVPAAASGSGKVGADLPVLFMECEADLLRAFRGPVAAEKKAREIAVAYEDGKATALAAYEALLAVAAARKEARAAVGGVGTPEGLLGSVQGNLVEARDSLMTACGVRAESWEVLAAYINEQKPALIQAAKQKGIESRQAETSAYSSLASARQEVGLRSVAEIQGSPEYQAWAGYNGEIKALGEESNRLFGVGPSDGLAAGARLKVEQATLLVPFPMGDRRPAKNGATIKQAVKLAPGDEVEILERRLDGYGHATWYLAKAATGARGYIHPAALSWYDTRERLDTHAEQRAAWRKPRVETLEKRYFTDKGLNIYEVDALASRERWGWLAMGYPPQKP